MSGSSSLRKAINLVKDRTSIGLMKVSRKVVVGTSSSSQIELLILKATGHGDLPIDNGHVERIVLLASSSSANMVSCTSAISHRLTHARHWIVVLKCLHLVHRLLRHDHGQFFAFEALSILSRLSYKNPRQDHVSTFIHALASYLDKRLHCTHHSLADFCDKKFDVTRARSLVERITHWQELLDRATAMTATVVGRRNRLVHATLQEVVCESFEVYGEVKEGLRILVDRFLDMETGDRVETYRACVTTSRQAAELAGFYESCRTISEGWRGVGVFLPHMEGVRAEVLLKLHGLLRTPQGGRKKKKKNRRKTKKMVEDWEMVLMDTVSSIERGGSCDGIEEGKVDVNNPFFDDHASMSMEMVWETPIFRAGEMDGEMDGSTGGGGEGGGALEEMRVREEQRMWLQRQQMIIANRKL